MGLTRSSSGLLVRDEFGSDTTANYNTISGVTKTISNGHFSLGTNDAWAVHKDSVGAKCVTALWYYNNSWSSQIMLSANGTLASSADYDGYGAAHNSGYLNIYRHTNGSDTKLAETSWNTGAATLTYRIYLTATGVTARAGTTTLGTKTVSSTDTTYTTNLYGGWRDYGSDYLDWLDIRTAHTITCTGMTTGHYLRVSDGTTAAEAAESSGTATVDAGSVLFPLASVQIRTAAAGGGDLIAEITSATLADMGGGDAFAYSAASAYFFPEAFRTEVIGYGGLTLG